MTTVAPKITVLDETIAELTARLEQALKRAAALETAIAGSEKRIARGTTPPPDAAPAAPVERLRRRAPRDTMIETETEELTSPERALERALRAKPSTPAELAASLEMPVGHVVIALRTLRRAGKIVNVGTADVPVWSWPIGDDTPTVDLMAAVEALIRTRPLGLHELAAATGARANRISGVLVKLRRAGLQVENRGTGRRALWSVV